MRVPAAFLGLTAVAAMIAAPVPASAHDHWHRGHGPGLLFPLAIAGAVVGAAATIATAPVRILADAAAAPAYAPAPAPTYYAAPAPAPQAYYAPPPQAYYPPPQAYYPPPPAAYYPPPQAYYYPPR